MSLIQIINNHVKNGFIPLLCEKFNLEEEEIEKLWMDFTTGKCSKSKKKSVKIISSDVDLSEEEEQEEEETNQTLDREALSKLKLTDLKEICRKKKLKVSGTKSQVIDRILDLPEESLPTKKKASKKPVLEKIEKPEIKIEKNDYGNLIHIETKIVFREEEEEINGYKCRMAIGIENEEGSVDPLSSEVIETCKQYGFKYQVPDNLDEE